jgi:hypothetical protein
MEQQPMTREDYVLAALRNARANNEVPADQMESHIGEPGLDYAHNIALAHPGLPAGIPAGLGAMGAAVNPATYANYLQGLISGRRPGDPGQDANAIYRHAQDPTEGQQ